MAKSVSWVKKKDLGKFYGVEEGRYHRPGQNWTDDPDPGEYDKRLRDAAMGDYDTRIAMNAWNMAQDNPEFKESLGRKLNDFMDEYKPSKKKGSEKGGRIEGISNMNELSTMYDFQKLYHKHARGNGGAFTSWNDRGGNSSHMEAAMRDFLSRDNEPEEASNNRNHNPQPALSFNQQLERGNISEKVLSAMDRVSAYEDAMRNGNRSPIAEPVVDEQMPGYDPVTSEEMNKRMNFLANYQFTPREA